METTSNKKNDAKTLSAEDWEKLCDDDRRVLLYTRLCGGVVAKTKEPVEYADWFLSNFYRDGRFRRRLPYLIAEAESAAQFGIFERIRSLISDKYKLERVRLAVKFGGDSVAFGLFVSNSALDDSVELEDDVLRAIRADLGKTFAFLDGEPRDVAEEVVALGLGQYPPDIYVSKPDRRNGTVSMNFIAAVAMLVSGRTLAETDGEKEDA